MKTVLGIDPSLTCTGVASRYHCTSIPTKHLKAEGRHLHTLIRRQHISRLLIDNWMKKQYAIIVVEGMYPHAQSGQLDRAMLFGDILRLADNWGSHVLIVPPKNVKKYATGSGNADKAAMVQAAYTWGIGQPLNDNEADALWLCAIAYELFGQPLARLPQAQRAALGVLDNDDAWLRGRPEGLPTWTT